MGPVMTKTQTAAILIFLKEAALQIENALNVATQAADQPTEDFLANLLRELLLEISRFEQLHRA
ncbi:MAG: hypothetical protein WBP94_13635 [Rhodomicrobiaceae bacterium]